MNPRYKETLPPVTLNYKRGRRLALSEDEARECIRMFNEGTSVENITKHFGVSRSTVYNTIKQSRKENLNKIKKELLANKQEVIRNG